MNNKLNNALDCVRAHIWTTQPDSLENIFCHLSCDSCQDKNFCLQIKRVVEVELNTRHQNNLVRA